MSAQPWQKHFDHSIKSRTVQGLIAFAVGSVMYYLTAVLFYPWQAVNGFLYTNLSYNAASLPWSRGTVVWMVISSTLVSLLLFVIVVALITAIMVFIFNRLGVRAKRPVINRVFVWSLVANVLVFALSYGMAYLDDGRTTSVWLQTVVGYTELLCIGLPYTFAWLWATRGHKALDLGRRKR